MKFFRHFLVFLFTLLTFKVYGIVPVVTYSPADYDGGMQNWSIDIQRNGWIYVANNYGLLEYDGDKWQLYGIWNSTVLRSVAIADDGDIYVGATNEFGRFVANDNGGLSYHNLSESVPANNRFFGEVWNINFLNNNVYFQTNNDLFVFNSNLDSLVSVIHRSEHIYCSASINHGIYVATSQGIYSLIGSNMNLLQGSDLLKGYEIRSLCALNANSFLIATDLGGLFVYDGKQISRYHTSIDDFLYKNQIYTMAISDKYVALGTVLGGIALIDYSGKEVQYYGINEGLQNNTILSLNFDGNGYLWAGLDNGLAHVFVDYPLINMFSNHSIGAGYTFIEYGTASYYGTNQGLYYSSINSSSEPDLISGSQGQVWSLDTICGLLFCSHHRGLFMVDKNKFLPIVTTTGFWSVRRLDANHLIAGAYDGLYIFSLHNGNVVFKGKVRDFDETAFNFQIDNHGRVWFNGLNGIYRLKINTEQLEAKIDTLLNKNSRDEIFYIAACGNKLLITNATECYVVNDNGDIVNENDELSDFAGLGLYYKFVNDNNGDLWFLTPHRLHVKRHSRGESDVIIDNPHFFIDGFYYISQLDSISLILGGADGFYTLNTSLLKYEHEQNAETLYVRKIISTNNHDSVVYGESYRPIDKEIILSYDNNSLRFCFGSSVDNICEYSVRLEPVEKDYSAWNTLNIKEYTSLREGTYTLNVKMRYQGVESIEKSVAFTILPPWYRRWYAYAVYVIFAILVIGMLIYILYSQVQMRETQLKIASERELKEQEQKFQRDAYDQEKRILELEKERVNADLKHKSQEMSNLLLSQVNRQEILQEIQTELYKINDTLNVEDTLLAKQKLQKLLEKIAKLSSSDIDWKKFEDNFDVVNDKFLEKLTAKYPTLNKNERKLCVYIRMGLYTKEIAPLLNMSVRGVEMLRYRMRRKMDLEREENLEQMLLTL